jgi:hypothetical protein
MDEGMDNMKKFMNMTKDGSEVKFYEMDAGGEYPIHGAINIESLNYWAAISWTKNGKVIDSVEESRYDLMPIKGFEPKDREPVWVKIDKSNIWFPRIATGKDIETYNETNSSSDCWTDCVPFDAFPNKKEKKDD